MKPSADALFENATQWKAEMLLLRKIVQETELVEEVKWYQPCYTCNGKNVLIISCFKEHCILSFIKGVLINDVAGILVTPGENSQSVRFAKFTNATEIKKATKIIKQYVLEAIANEKANKKVALKKVEDYHIPEEFKQALAKDKTLKKAFETLTAGRQRFYLMHFSAAKQAATRIARIEKYIPKILDGKGFND
jgi:uncharacterized protein YdeI (YjbR/CyaY-like superfamily)